MDCARVRELLSCLVDGELGGQSLESVEVHMSACDGCRRELDATRALVAAAALVGQVQPPAGLKHGILRAVREAQACERISAMLSAYLDSELADAERDRVTAHLEACERCSRELGALKLLVGAAGAIEQLEPPERLRLLIKDASAARAPGKSVLGMGPLGWFRSVLAAPAARWAGAAAAVAIAALAMVWIPEPREQVRTVQQRADRTPSRVTRPSPQAAPQTVASQPAVPAPSSAAVVATRRHRAPSSVRQPEVALDLTALPKPEPPEPAAKPTLTIDEPPLADTPAPSEPALDQLGAEPVVAAAPEPAPEIRTETARSEQPALIKVASAPPVAPSDAEQWIQQVKTQASLRSKPERTGVSILSARF